MLGTREPDVYGAATLDEINAMIRLEAQRLGIETEIFQSNSEGCLIDFIQRCSLNNFLGYIINPGAYTHYSYALRDAVAGIAPSTLGERPPVIEVHISNIYSREEFRSRSVIAPVCTGQISGLGAYGYIAALNAVSQMLKLF